MSKSTAKSVLFGRVLTFNILKNNKNSLLGCELHHNHLGRYEYSQFNNMIGSHFKFTDRRKIYCDKNNIRYLPFFIHHEVNCRISYHACYDAVIQNNRHYGDFKRGESQGGAKLLILTTSKHTRKSLNVTVFVR